MVHNHQPPAEDYKNQALAEIRVVVQELRRPNETMKV